MALIVAAGVFAIIVSGPVLDTASALPKPLRDHEPRCTCFRPTMLRVLCHNKLNVRVVLLTAEKTKESLSRLVVAFKISYFFVAPRKQVGRKQIDNQPPEIEMRKKHANNGTSRLPLALLAKGQWRLGSASRLGIEIPVPSPHPANVFRNMGI